MIYQAQVGLMHQSRGLQSVTLAFLPQVTGGELAEFLVNQRCEVIEGLPVTLRPLRQQGCHVMVRRCAHVLISNPHSSVGLYNAIPMGNPIRNASNMIGFSSDFRMTR